MSFLNNLTSVAFTSEKPVDKLVRVFTGAYTSSDLITRVGSIGTAYLYRIPHGLTRPIACELLWSSDNGASWNDGGTLNAASSQRLAFSDSTYAYIFEGYSAPVGTILYKVYGSWIDNYDTTNPLVSVQSYTSLPTQFDSRLNYQKIDDQNVLSFAGGTFGSSLSQVVLHPLGYAPNTKIFFEAVTGEVWPLNAGGASNFFLYDASQDECRLSITSSQITVTMDRYSGISRRAWYRIYYDA